jgi:ABC-2 type transport system ATP-binding protein
MSITVSHITKLYGRQKALDDVSFSAGSGSITGFIGPNGAGKSTMMKIITGYIPPNEGEVQVAGQNVLENPMEVRERTGYLPENNPLYPEMYVREYLQYVAGHYHRVANPSARIEEVIVETGLTPESHKKIGALSKGYRQRVGLAQAILHDPAVLILDEPTSGLDPNQIVEIRELIHRLGSEKTVLLSTHIMQEVEAICDRVIIISRGKVVADGKPGEISAGTETATGTILVEFDKSPDTEKLGAIVGVLRIKAVGDLKFLVETAAGTDLRPVIFRFAVDEGLTVLSMQRKEKSLEEVFREIT